MQTLYVYLIGILVLVLGWPIGDFLAKKTKEELKSGQIWFKALIIVALLCSVGATFLKNDALFFAFLFIAIVTSRSLKK